MDLTKVIFVSMALVATSSGFLPGKARQDFFSRQRQSQGFNPKLSVRTSVSGMPRRMSSQSAPTLNQKLSLRNLPRNHRPINIISNIILSNPTNKPPGSPNNPAANQKQPTGGQGRIQGRGQGHTSRGRNPRGRIPRPYRIFNSNNRGNIGRLPSGKGSRAHGRQRAGVGNFHSNFPAARSPRIRSFTGGRIVGGRFGSPSGRHGQVAHLILPIVNATGFSSLFTGQTLPGGSATGSGGSKSQVLILPNGPNTGTLVLSTDQGMGFQEVKSVGGGGATAGNGGQKPSSGKSTGFFTVSTLKPGEDPPEIESVSL